jgi:hypothetical protein
MVSDGVKFRACTQRTDKASATPSAAVERGIANGDRRPAWPSGDRKQAKKSG